MTALPATLNVGYSTRTKLAVTGIAALGWVLMLTLSGDDLANVSVIPYVAALLASVFLLSTVRSGFVIDAGALHHTTWRGTKSYAANDFLSANAVTDKNGKAGVVLPFRTGIVMLTASRGCSDPNAIARYIASEWTAEDPAYAQPLGPVNEDLVLQYETIHIALLTVATVVLAALAVAGPMFWVDRKSTRLNSSH